MKPVAGVITGIVILLGIINFVGIASLIPILAKMDFHYLLQAIYISIAILVFHSLRLKFILNAQKYPLSLWNATKIHVSTNTLNLMTPVVKVGGIPMKIDYLSKTNIPSIMSCASVVGEIVTETLSFFTTLVLLMLYLIFTDKLPSEYAYLGSFILLVFGGLLLVSLKIIFSRKSLENFIRRGILRFTTIDASLASKQFNCSINTYVSNKPLLYGTLFISFFCRLLELARINLIFLAFGFNVSLGLIITVWVLEAFFSGVPWLPGGIGLVEVGSIYALTLLMVPVAIATPIILINRLVSHWTPLLIGGVVMSSLKRNGIRCEI
jgi:glycosyltransferase 2 family protein